MRRKFSRNFPENPQDGPKCGEITSKPLTEPIPTDSSPKRPDWNRLRTSILRCEGKGISYVTETPYIETLLEILNMAALHPPSCKVAMAALHPPPVRLPFSKIFKIPYMVFPK